MCAMSDGFGHNKGGTAESFVPAVEQIEGFFILENGEDMMKKILALGIAVLLFGLAACTQTTQAPNTETQADGTESSTTTEATDVTTDDRAFTIGISQLAQHPALDAARQGFEDGLKEAGVQFTVDYKNAQGEVPTASLIAEGFVTDGVNLIYAIATSAAQSATQTTSTIPILFSAVTDPVQAKLVASTDAPGGNVTGTSDAADIERQVALFQELDPNIKTIGVIYNTSEVNSEIQVNQIKEIAPKYNMEVKEVGINNIHEISQAMETLVTQIDGLYIPSDNMIASSVSIVADILKENKVPSVSAEASQLEGGTLLTEGLSYYELGKQTAEMAKKILVDGVNPAEIPVEYAKVKVMTVNKTTAEALGIDLNAPMFANAEFVE